MSSSTPAGQAFFQYIRVAASGIIGSGYTHAYSGTRINSSDIWMFNDDNPALESTTANSGAIPTYKLGIGAITNSDTTQASYNLFYTTGFCWGGALSKSALAQVYTAFALYNSKLGRFVP